jgi:hypothetical protein
MNPVQTAIHFVHCFPSNECNIYFGGNSCPIYIYFPQDKGILSIPRINIAERIKSVSQNLFLSKPGFKPRTYTTTSLHSTTELRQLPSAFKLCLASFRNYSWKGCQEKELWNEMVERSNALWSLGLFSREDGGSNPPALRNGAKRRSRKRKRKKSLANSSTLSTFADNSAHNGAEWTSWSKSLIPLFFINFCRWQAASFSCDIRVLKKELLLYLYHCIKCIIRNKSPWEKKKLTNFK